jgi:hypothetical protein
MQEMMAGFENAAKEREAEAMAELRKKGIILHVVQTGFSIPGEQRTRFIVKRTRHPGTITLEEASAAEAEYLKARTSRRGGPAGGPAMLFRRR